MKKTILCILLLVLTYSHAQIAQPKNDSFNELVFFVGTNTSKYDKAEGSRYIANDFKSAKINNYAQTQLVRFNIIENLIEVKKADGTIMSLSKSYPYTITFLDGSNKVYETRAYVDDEGNQRNTFFEKIHTANSYSLFLRSRVKYIPGRPEKSSYEPAKPAKFVGLDPVYHVTDNSDSKNLLQIPTKKKQFLRLYKNKSKELDAFIKQNKLRLDTSKDLIAALDFYYEKE